jgi:hypothetical protein
MNLLKLVCRTGNKTDPIRDYMCLTDYRGPRAMFISLINVFLCLLRYRPLCRSRLKQL